jgi:hypothetical protein
MGSALRERGLLFLGIDGNTLKPLRLKGIVSNLRHGVIARSDRARARHRLWRIAAPNVDRHKDHQDEGCERPAIVDGRQ